MIDNDLVYAKVGNIQNCLRRVRQVSQLDPDRLDDLDVQDIFVLNLQRAVQSAIDLSSHLVAAEELGLPATLKDHFTLLQNGGILSKELAARMIKMVGFRNIAVHDYQSLNIAVLKEILTKHLADLENFCASVLKFYRL